MKNNILYICIIIIAILLMFEMSSLQKDIKEYDRLVSIHGATYKNEKLIGKTIIINFNDNKIELQEKRVLLLLVQPLSFLYFIFCIIQLILMHENRKFKNKNIII